MLKHLPYFILCIVIDVSYGNNYYSITSLATLNNTPGVLLEPLLILALQFSIQLSIVSQIALPTMNVDSYAFPSVLVIV